MDFQRRREILHVHDERTSTSTGSQVQHSSALACLLCFHDRTGPEHNLGRRRFKMVEAGVERRRSIFWWWGISSSYATHHSTSSSALTRPLYRRLRAALRPTYSKEGGVYLTMYMVYFGYIAHQALGEERNTRNCGRVSIAFVSDAPALVVGEEERERE